jgi:hypothetical protein
MTPRLTINERSDALTKVRTNIEPGVVHEVDAAELLDLERQGLIYSFERDEHTDALGLKVGDFARWQAADRKADVVTAPPAATATNTDLNTEGK